MLTSRSLSQPPSERYTGLVAAALEDPAGIILPEEAARLDLFRARHRLSQQDHVAALT